MELKYRGVSYYTNPTRVRMEKKENTVMFRGCSYKMRGAVLNVKDNSDKAKRITYRAVKTGKTYQQRFLGQSCMVEKVTIQPVSV